MDERIRRIVVGSPIPDRLIRNLSRAPLLRHPRENMVLHLTLTERWIVLMLAGGYSVPRIADELGVSYAAAKEKVRRIRAFYDAPTRTRAIAEAFREGDLTVRRTD